MSRELRSDDLRVRQILVNLVGNAIKFTENGTVTVGLQTAPRASNEDQVDVILSLQDTGSESPKDVVGTLFEKFSQADSSTTKNYGGTGLGLAITRELAQRMGGSISVSSVWGQGSTFVVRLPLDPIDDSAPAVETGGSSFASAPAYQPMATPSFLGSEAPK